MPLKTLLRSKAMLGWTGRDLPGLGPREVLLPPSELPHLPLPSRSLHTSPSHAYLPGQPSSLPPAPGAISSAQHLTVLPVLQSGVQAPPRPTVLVPFSHGFLQESRPKRHEQARDVVHPRRLLTWSPGPPAGKMETEILSYTSCFSTTCAWPSAKPRAGAF